MARKPSGRKTIGVENAVHYRGVRMRRCGKFVAEIRNPATKSGIWLGTYYTEVEAARAYDAAAARQLRDHNARTIFPLFSGAAMQGFGNNRNFLVSSPLDLTLAPPRNFPAECYHLLCHFSAVHHFGHRQRRLLAMAPPPLGLKLSRKSMKEIILAYEELLRVQAVKPRPDGLDLDLNRPPPENV